MDLSTFKLFKEQKYKNGIEITGDKLKKLKKILLEMLIDIDDVCAKNNLYYTLCGGTALGAVRHNGFIPWDDDVDIFMTRESYNKFLKIYYNELKDKYTLHSPETTPELGMPLAQISLNGTVYKTHLAPERKNPGIFVDIFILENTPDNVVLRDIHVFFSLFFGLALSCSRFYKDRKFYLQAFDGADIKTLRAIKNKIFLGKLFNVFLSTKKWVQLTNWWNSLCKNNNSKYVSVPSGRKHYFGELYLRSEMCAKIVLPFETEVLSVMHGYDYYFKKLYGYDYMTPPPESDREVHCVFELDFGKNIGDKK